MYVDPITFVVAFGAVVVSFLWLRDTRIYARTGLAGYRKAAYQGVLFTALGWFAAAVAGLADTTLLYLGCGLVLLALYLQSRINRGDVWKGNESALQRLTGAAPRQNPQRKQ
ncbi:MAG: ABC transporter permease [Methanocorpusculum sp.]|nr:ABC transporter permease [Methanocorpusculum sp.]